MRVLETAGHQMVSAINEAHVIAGTRAPRRDTGFRAGLHRHAARAVQVGRQREARRERPDAERQGQDQVEAQGRLPAVDRRGHGKIRGALAAWHPRAGYLRHPRLHGLADRRRRDPRPPALEAAHDRDRRAAGAPDRHLDRQREDRHACRAAAVAAARRQRSNAGPTGDLAFIVTRRGTPWTKGALGTEFVAAARAAGVVGKSAHGMRKAAATRAAENGATERELEAIFGWSGGRMATLYTKSANRGRLAAGAIGKLDRAETEDRTSIPAPMAEVRAGNRKRE